MNVIPTDSPARTDTAPALRAYLDASERLVPFFPGGTAAVLDHIEDVWLTSEGRPLHLDLHRAQTARATVVFQPGSGSYARFYCALGAQLAANGIHFLGIDRPGHGYSGGARGDCTIAEALEASARVLDYARAEFGLPVILIGSSLGGLLAGFALCAGQRPDLAIAHNFIIPGRLISLRMRGRFIERFRRRPYPLGKLVHDFKGISDDPVLLEYLAQRADPYAAWELSARAVASLFRHNTPRPARPTPPFVVLSGTADKLIPGWASRWFLRWSRLKPSEYRAVPNAGHMLFHDHLAESLPLLLDLIGEVARSRGGRG
jgi:alpha-beta hydrolase superfamily lysophospholipase